MMAKKETGKVKVLYFSTNIKSSVCEYRVVCVCLTWSDDYALGLFNHLDSLIHIDFCVCPCDLHGLSCAGGRCAIASQDHISQ